MVAPEGPFVEVLPGHLFWAPLRDVPPTAFSGKFRQALDVCRLPGDIDEAWSAEYAVMHYAPEAYGRAFGPLGLDTVLLFCRGLTNLLDRMADGAVAIGTAPGDVEQRTNVAVLMGAYLIFRKGWSAEDVAKALGKDEAGLMFACSWTNVARPEPKRNLSVRDCWDGLELAGMFNWVDDVCLESDVATCVAVKRWRDWVATCDCSWLVPGFILVGADPVTTAKDPNPTTFEEVFPKKIKAAWTQATVPVAETRSSSKSTMLVDSPQVRNSGRFSFATRASSKSIVPIDAPLIVESANITTYESRMSKASSEFGARESVQTVHTVCKDYSPAIDVHANPGGGMPSFVAVLQHAGVTTVVRTNSGKERGMPPGGGYDEEEFADYSIMHYDVQILDTHGGLPKREDVEKVLRCCPDGRLCEGAVFVHCKGGFGRSVTLASCLAIERLDLDGAAFLGWARIVRPGAINTPEQEQLLRSFRGREDVRRFAGLDPRLGLAGTTSRGSTKACCTVQ
mmetsp:Transcript_73507/g.212915  ORF Transcript_73507/g.212915 Transcript_73507/m.212915 type:complete len:509 (+) Transcript_73507:40-1566(+)